MLDEASLVAEVGYYTQKDGVPFLGSLEQAFGTGGNDAEHWPSGW